jgi:long-chain acyl-CoA synthetase
MRNLRPFEYHNDPAKTAAAVRGDRLTVGDLGWMDKDGYLYIADRRDDLVISGGVNIYPAEIEAVLLGHPAVADAAVIGVPDTELQQVVHAVVELRTGEDPAALTDELRSLCERKLGSQKRPKSIEFRPALPRTESGKLLRRKLQDEYWSAAESEGSRT